jgi:hypothetical protein
MKFVIVIGLLVSRIAWAEGGYVIANVSTKGYKGVMVCHYAGINDPIQCENQDAECMVLPNQGGLKCHFKDKK